MRAALRRALVLERVSFTGEGWVTARYRRTLDALIRRGLVDTYRVTPRGQVFYLINDAGRAEVGAPPAVVELGRAA
jgi:hypothetical protein